MPTILVADPDSQTAEMIEERLPREAAIRATTRSEDVLRALADEPIDLLVADSHLPGLGGSELLPYVREHSPETQVLLVAAFGSVEDAVDAIHAGAADFLCKPFTSEQLDVAIRRALDTGRLRRENRSLRRALELDSGLDRIVSTDPAMARIFKTIRAVAGTRSTVLLTGESGTGKTMLARAIHRASDRADRPFVEVNCGALPESLLESELFGHVRGSFTGAVRDRAGKFEEADGGTIFLDEIGTSSPGLQVKLLRVLQDRVLERVGDSKRIPVDVRIVLATNLDLAAEVAAGRFREDLYYRINVIALEMPPLRDRRGDIALLAEHFVRRLADENGRPQRGITRAAIALLEQAPWPGNVRQLENVLERAVVLCEGDEIDVADLPPDLLAGRRAATDEPSPQSLIDERAHLMPLKTALEAPERALIERALRHFDGNRQRTAESLGINRSTLFAKMRRLGIS